MSDQGASQNERLLQAAKTDNEELVLEILNGEKEFDINFQDGLGFTALHYAIQRGSTDCLDHLLETEDCDVDLQTRLDASTPLHLAVQVSDSELRLYLVRTLLEAGASQTIRNKFKDTPIDLLSPTKPEDQEVREVLLEEKGQEELFDQGDLVGEDDLADGSGSESD
ncbi:ankyrin repeat-containing domain protein [Mrakia frigida]|uniref:ankyrin repeat-containing protein ANK1 n=1 Tax=Mrakia frigida TaxID=29902 RepID=UPI003FCBF75E